MIYESSCHCGNITGQLESEIKPEKFELRRCLCNFCIKHGAITATDPNGLLRLNIGVEKDTSHYRFGLRTAEFVVCSVCGVYVAAILEADGGRFSTFNINTMKNVADFRGTPTPVNYEKESAMEKVSRRRLVWTPTVFEKLAKR